MFSASLLVEIFCQLFGKSVAKDTPAIRHQWVAAVMHRFIRIVLNGDLENRSHGVFVGVEETSKRAWNGKICNFFITGKEKKCC